ncbi:MAG: proline racemase family protein [Thiocapsa sp.]|nr:proline racemase family protein [Thiocapsa sp.]MCG6895893.1 proline racemase family protein [Thiocapsa sp.]
MAQFSHIVSAIDTHTAGEPARIVLSGLPPIRGDTMAQKKRYMREKLDRFRTLLMLEPRGHKDMFGVVLTPPVSREAQYGVLFIDSAGYIDMCGHSVMAAATALIETGMIPAAGPETTLVLDTPAGQVRAHAKIAGNRVVEVSVANVASFVYAADVSVDLPGRGRIRVDIAFGGNFFALAEAASLGISIRPDHTARLVELGMSIKKAVNAQLAVRHPTNTHIDRVELVQIYERPEPSQHLIKNAVVFGDGQLDRCPCGTGTSAAMAALFVKGELPLGTECISEGILGTRFKGRLLREARCGDLTAVEPLVTGVAHITGIQQLAADPDDPLKYGFLIGSAGVDPQ